MRLIPRLGTEILNHLIDVVDMDVLERRLRAIAVLVGVELTE